MRASHVHLVVALGLMLPEGLGCQRKNAGSLQTTSRSEGASPKGTTDSSPTSEGSESHGSRAKPLAVARTFFELLKRKDSAVEPALVGFPFVLSEAQRAVCPSGGGVAETLQELDPLLDCVRSSEFFIRALSNNPDPVFDTGTKASALIESVAPDAPPLPANAVPVVATLSNNDSAIFLIFLVSGGKVGEVRVVMTFEPN
jgi:hypothetical protein